ncbi:rho GTPase-activating protein 44-like isoform X2 [Leptopilina boulardi]|uniref:rho GTPase-activating protein 44-like isoform X2 n=1 Tax=Leptopilina boulardi TaxID=63433 RepID=UPI0021F5327C|nr:rho GTPase-activating protein 44-like isoform X2 [Leptopilina boulardi]
MKKQFFRVKQLADQTFSRAGKTEVLTDDLQAADKHVEQIRGALNGLSKRFGNLPNQAVAQDCVYKEKRLKKCPEWVLGQTMLEGTGDETLLSFVMSECGRAQVALATETVEHESKVEQYVAAPLLRILETDVPNILKFKRNLQRLTLDMDSARTRYHQASKHNASGTGATKVDSLKDELEEAEAKVEQCRDHLAAEMFQLMSRETELAQIIIQYVKLQRAYHESMLHCLEDLIPGLECYINNNEMKPVYGYSLEEHLRVTNRKIALPIQLCVSALLRLGMEEEGLFRIAGGASKLRRIKLSLDACCLNLPTALEYKDPHVIAGALKSYLRELPVPLLTFDLYPEWMAAAKVVQNEARLKALWEVLHKLPPANLENLRFLIKFLAMLTKNQDINKMTPHNIAIVIAPNLIWSPPEDLNPMAMEMSTANNSSLIVDQLVTYADWFFPGEIDFDRDLDVGIVNGSENQVVGMRRCMSNSSLSDLGESPPQGSPKPATRRKNKPAPIPPPPSSTPDKHERKPDDKPPPAPDKPPRPLATATLNRVTYKAQKHEVNAELINPSIRNAEKIEKNSERNVNKSINCDVSTKPVVANQTENIVESRKEQQQQETIIAKSNFNQTEQKNTEELKSVLPIGFEGLVKSELDVNNKANVESENLDNNSPKVKSMPSEKTCPTTQERRPIPVAAPRSITNISLQITDDTVELRRKPEISTGSEKNHKPAIPERPAGLARPSSLIRPQPRHSNENLDNESGLLTLERAHMYSVDKQQRSPSVGSRPSSMSLSCDRPEKPPRPDVPEPTKAHTRTRSEGNIIDVQTQTDTIIVSKSQQQPSPASPRFLQRPPRPQPPPPPPPTARAKSEQESTNL